MPGHRPAISRPRPDGSLPGSFPGGSLPGGSLPGGEGGNRAGWLAAALNPNTLLAAALVISAAFVSIATAVLY